MKRLLGLVISALILAITAPQALAADKLRLQAAFAVAFVSNPQLPAGNLLRWAGPGLQGRGAR